MMPILYEIIFLFWLVDECTASNKYYWYFDGGYPIYFICRSYEDCCGARCCVRALSIQRLWYFWRLLTGGWLIMVGMKYSVPAITMSPSSPIKVPPGHLWLLLMMGVLFCCGVGFFIRRRVYPYPFPKRHL